MLCLQLLLSPIPPNQPRKTPSSPHQTLRSSSSTFIKFQTSHRENLRFLNSLHIIPNSTPKIFTREEVTQILTLVNFLKSNGFSDANLQRLSFLCPNLFHSGIHPADVAPVFDFLSRDLSASRDEACGLVLRCPDLLFAHVDSCLRPTLEFLTNLGFERLNSPNSLNAHLINTRVEKLVENIRFLEGLGLSSEEAARVCVRFPAVFGYSVENNLRPKVEFLIEMERSLDELKGFPQYFGFNLERRIVPRHWHLKERNVRVSLQKMLMLSDDKFYARWK
ncbi:hypothetical protein Sjap_010396 [Stephania japonica]|uniref:Uncharacterized protein n=1 Tax=Stephania japonica TaxID=461633 RepID=A0AAP0P4J8_9MAGN